LFNSLGWERHELVTLRVSTRKVQVLDAVGQPVYAQLDPFWTDNAASLPSTSEFTLHFLYVFSECLYYFYSYLLCVCIITCVRKGPRCLRWIRPHISCILT